MTNGMLETLEEVLQETDEIKAKLKERGINPSIRIELCAEDFSFSMKKTIVIDY